MQNYLKFLVGYLLIFVAVPYIILLSSYKPGHYSALADYLGFYCHLIAPLIAIPFYLLAKCQTKKEKFIFITFGFIIPFGIIYWLAYLDYLKNFNPGHFS